MKKENSKQEFEDAKNNVFEFAADSLREELGQDPTHKQVLERYFLFLIQLVNKLGRKPTLAELVNFLSNERTTSKK